MAPGPTPRISRRARVALAAAALAAARRGARSAGSAPAQRPAGAARARPRRSSRPPTARGRPHHRDLAASEQIPTLREVADLRNREAAVAGRAGAEAGRARGGPEPARGASRPAQRAIEMLEDRLVAIYKSGEPDVLTVVLEADGFDDLLERTEYLQRLEDQDSAIVGPGPRAAQRDAGDREHGEGGARRDRRAQAGAGADPRRSSSAAPPSWPRPASGSRRPWRTSATSRRSSRATF